MTDLVDRTLKKWRQSSFEYGETDCLMSIGDYVAENGGVDLTGNFRNTYADDETAIELLEQYGGFAGFMELADLKPIEPSEIQRGDIVLIDTLTGGELVGICTGEGIAARAKKTVFEVSRRFVTIRKAWKL